MRKYFGTDGIRKIANSELTPELSYKVAKASAYVLSKELKHMPTILIGRDTRISGSLIESAMVAGFLSVGANVKTLGVIPTPVVAYLTRELKADASVVISASHNSYEFNGIKFFNNKGMKLADEIEEQIEEVMESAELLNVLPENDKIGILENSEEISDAYVDFLTKHFNFENIDKNNFIVGLDVANGATFKIAEEIFTNFGINYKIISNNPNGININEKCGSTNLENLRKLVLENKLNIGIAYDGDGDRCLAIDEKGNTIDGDVILAIFASYLKENKKLNKDTIVATVMSNLGLKKFAEINKMNFVETKVGDRYVLEKMLKEEYNLGGEQSGHIILSDYNSTGDGILTSLMLIKILLEKNMSLSSLANQIKIYPQVLVNVKVDNDKKLTYEQNDEIKNLIQKTKDELADKGRILVRPSGTEPIIRVMIEGEDYDAINKSANEIGDLIKIKLN